MVVRNELRNRNAKNLIPMAILFLSMTLNAGEKMNDTNTKMKIDGDPNKVDSYAACITAVAKALNCNVDYWYIEALTGTSFSPCLNKSEDCIGWMVDGSNSGRYEFIGKAIGIQINKISQQAGAPDKWTDAYSKDKTTPPQVEEYFTSMKKVYQSNGHIVIKTWPAWSILSGWNDDHSNLPFMTTPGFESTVKSIWPPLKSKEYYSLTKAPNQMKPDAVIKEALHFAYEIASNNFTENKSEFNGNNVFGGMLYDKVIEITGGKYLCPGCKEHGCFGRMIKRINDGHECSVAFLNYANKQSGNSNNAGAFKKAIQDYSDMRSISGKYLDWQSFGSKYDDPEFRKELAAGFNKMKEMHGDAATELKKINTTL